MRKESNLLVELGEKLKKLLIQQIFDETGLICEILCIYVESNYVAVVKEIKSEKNIWFTFNL